MQQIDHRHPLGCLMQTGFQLANVGILPAKIGEQYEHGLPLRKQKSRLAPASR
jgi:hypothetical protein